MIPTIETERLILRQVVMEDENDLFEIFSDDQTCLDGGGKYARKKHDPEFHDYVSKLSSQRRYAVLLKQEMKCLGLVSLLDEKRAVTAYSLGFVMNPKYRRAGYCFEAVNAVTQYWFEKTDLQMLTTSHFPHNAASEKLIRRLGFTFEGLTRKAMLHALYGPIDLICYYKEKPL